MHKTSEWLLSFKSETGASQLKTRNPFKPCTKISITGGKGGVGKTSIALKMAKELAQAGYRTLLVDCDSNLSNTAIKLGIPLDDKFERLLSAQISFEECLVQHGRLHILPACNGSLEIFENKLKLDEIIGDIITSHEHEYDYVLLDCPAGLSREALTLNAACDYRFVVVTPDKSSITDSYSLIKVLSQRFNVKENHILVNMYTSDKQLFKVISTVRETTRTFLGVESHFLGGINRLEVAPEGFDTFFLSDTRNEAHRNFIKLLYAFTEKVGGAAAGELRQTPETH